MAKKNEENLEHYLQMRIITDTLYDIQELRKATANRDRLMPKETATVKAGALEELEHKLTKQLEVMLRDEPIYVQFLSRVRGIATRISASIISQTMIRFHTVTKEELKEYSEEQQRLSLKTEGEKYQVPVIRGIQAFPTVGKWWAWSGLHVIDGRMPKRRKGQKMNWNPRMRVIAWKAGQQILKQGRGYRQIYDIEKDRLTSQRLPLGKCPEYEACVAKLKNASRPSCKNHIHKMAIKKAVKLLWSHTWEAWRRIEGLPVRPPYAIEYLGHSTWSDPYDFVEPEK